MLSNPAQSEDSTDKKQEKSKQHLRQNSESSLKSTTESVLGDSPMQVQEMQQTGSVGLSLYKKYFTAGGRPFTLTLLVSVCILTQVLASGGDYFLSYWVNKASVVSEKVLELSNTTSTNDSIISSIPEIFGNDSNSENIDIYIFSGITLLTIGVALARSFLIFSVAMKSSTNLHNSMFKGVSHASMYFFNTNPTGRILNRFSKDMGQVDELLPTVMITVITSFLSMFGIISVVAMVNAIYILPTVVLAFIFYLLRIFYLKTSMDVKRIEGISKVYF